MHYSDMEFMEIIGSPPLKLNTIQPRGLEMPVLISRKITHNPLDADRLE